MVAILTYKHIEYLFKKVTEINYYLFKVRGRMEELKIEEEDPELCEMIRDANDATFDLKSALHHRTLKLGGYVPLPPKDKKRFKRIK